MSSLMNSALGSLCTDLPDTTPSFVLMKCSSFSSDFPSQMPFFQAGRSFLFSLTIFNITFSPMRHNNPWYCEPFSL